MTRNEKYIKFNRELSQIESIFRLNKSSCWACAQDYEKTVSGLLSAFKHYTHFKTESEWVRVNTHAAERKLDNLRALVDELKGDTDDEKQ